LICKMHWPLILVKVLETSGSWRLSDLASVNSAKSHHSAPFSTSPSVLINSRHLHASCQLFCNYPM
jgi:hypothetical protein